MDKTINKIKSLKTRRKHSLPTSSANPTWLTNRTDSWKETKQTFIRTHHRDVTQDHLLGNIIVQTYQDKDRFASAAVLSSKDTNNVTSAVRNIEAKCRAPVLRNSTFSHVDKKGKKKNLTHVIDF